MLSAALQTELSGGSFKPYFKYGKNTTATMIANTLEAGTYLLISDDTIGTNGSPQYTSYATLDFYSPSSTGIRSMYVYVITVSQRATYSSANTIYAKDDWVIFRVL